MPASSTMALVAFSPKVTGRSRLIPARGPTPGRTPTSVPTRQPAKAYTSTSGDRAVAKPMERLFSISTIRPASDRRSCHTRRLCWCSSDGKDALKTERPLRQRHVQKGVEQKISAKGEAAGKDDAREPSLLLEDAYQREQRKEDRDAVSETLERKRHESAGPQDEHGVPPLRPLDGGRAFTGAPPDDHRDAAYQQGDCQERRHRTRPGLGEKSKRDLAGLPENQERERREERPRHLVDRQRSHAPALG